MTTAPCCFCSIKHPHACHLLEAVNHCISFIIIIVFRKIFNLFLLLFLPVFTLHPQEYTAKNSKTPFTFYIPGVRIQKEKGAKGERILHSFMNYVFVLKNAQNRGNNEKITTNSCGSWYCFTGWAISYNPGPRHIRKRFLPHVYGGTVCKHGASHIALDL